MYKGLRGFSLFYAAFEAFRCENNKSRKESEKLKMKQLVTVFVAVIFCLFLKPFLISFRKEDLRNENLQLQ